MKEIDYRKYIDAAVEMSRNSVDVHFSRRGYFNPGLGGVVLRDSLIDNVWNACLKHLTGCQKENGPLDAEKVICGLIRRGVSRDMMPFKGNSFRIRLNNYEYRVYKRASGLAARLWNTAGNELRELKVDPDEFAGFLLEFDLWVPEMLRAADEVFLYYKDKQCERQKEEIARQIMDRTVASLIDQYLRPLGLSASYRFVNEGTSVAIDIHQVLTGHLEVQVEELSERLKDTDAILGSLTADIPENDEQEEKTLYWTV